MKLLYLIFLGFLVIVLIQCSKPKELEERVHKIGQNLILLDSISQSNSNKNFLVKDVVNVGKNLFLEIQKNRPYNKVIFEIKESYMTIGDRTTDYILNIIKENKQIIVELKYDDSYDKFHILRFKTAKN